MSKNLAVLSIVAVLYMSGSQDRALAVTVSPSRVEVGVEASKGCDGVLTVSNTEKAAFNVKLRVEDRAAGLGIKWFDIAPNEFEINKDEIKNVKYTVTVPKDVKGELSVMVFVEAKPKEEAQGPVIINTSIGIPIYVMINGTEEFNAEVENVTIKDNSPLQLMVEINNSGNVHVRPEGTVTLRDKANKEILSVPLNEYKYPILPASKRTLEIKTDKTLVKGEYTADVKMAYADKVYEKKILLTIK